MGARDTREHVQSPPFAPDLRAAVLRDSGLGTRVGDHGASSPQGNRRAEGYVALAGPWDRSSEDPSSHGREASPSAAQSSAQPSPSITHRSVLPGVFSLGPRGTPGLRTPGVRPSACAPSHPSSGRRARGAPLQPLAAVRTGRRRSAERRRAEAGLSPGRRKPQRQQSPGGEVGERESGTPAQPGPDLRCPRSLLRARLRLPVPAAGTTRDPTRPALPCPARRFASYSSDFS